jgi:hypothetical protein
MIIIKLRFASTFYIKTIFEPHRKGIFMNCKSGLRGRGDSYITAHES